MAKKLALSSYAVIYLLLSATVLPDSSNSVSYSLEGFED